MSLCLAAGAKFAKVVATTFTLIWTHSIEKTRWEEVWRVEPGGLVLQSARIKGSGAGMEPPPHARKEGAWFSWSGDRQPLEKLVLARSNAVEDWRICTSYECLPFELLLGKGTEPVTLYPCNLTR